MSDNIKILYCNIRGLAKNRKYLSEIATCEDCDIIFCSETLVNGPNPIVAKYYIKGYSKAVLDECKTEINPKARGMALYIKKSLRNYIYRVPIYECTCHEIQVVKVSNFYIFSIYKNPNKDNSIYNCLLKQLSIIKNDDPNASFVFVGDYNAHHKEWLNSISSTNSSGIMALQFSLKSGCVQMINEATHISGNTLDLVFTNASSDIVTCSVNERIGTSDHNSILIKIAMSIEDMRETIAAATGEEEGAVGGICYNNLNPNNFYHIGNKHIAAATEEEEEEGAVGGICYSNLNPNNFYHTGNKHQSLIDWDVIINDVKSLKWCDIYKNPDTIECLCNKFNEIINMRIINNSSNNSGGGGCNQMYTHLYHTEEKEDKKKKKIKSRTRKERKEGNNERGIETTVATANTILPQQFSSSCFNFTSAEIKILLTDLDVNNDDDIASIFLKKTANVIAPKLARIFCNVVRKNQLENSSSSPISLIIHNMLKKLIIQHLCKYIETTSIS